MQVDPEQEAFAKYILELGNGNLPKNELNEIELPEDIISSGNLIEEVFGECLSKQSFDLMKDRVILASINKEVSKINAKIVDRLPGEYKSYKRYDSVKDEEKGGIEFTPEFLNSIDTADLPPHDLKIKKNTIVMLLRNLDISKRMCNWTRLIDN